MLIGNLLRDVSLDLKFTYTVVSLMIVYEHWNLIIIILVWVPNNETPSLKSSFASSYLQESSSHGVLWMFLLIYALC